MLIKSFNFNSYLEISSISSGYVFDMIHECVKKDIICYIPNGKNNLPNRRDINIKPSSFEFHYNRLKGNVYDIVFVDSWHTYEQSLFDIKIATEFVSPTGVIVIHDCCPNNKSLIGPYHIGSWCGQTYEAFINFRYRNNHLESFCIDTDFGCGIISMDKRFGIESIFEDYNRDKLANWEYYNLNKNWLLNLIKPDVFLNLCEETFRYKFYR